jgi:hypothetical protein
MSDEYPHTPDSYPSDAPKKRYKPKKDRVKHFEVSSMIQCKLDFDFALALGQLLLETETDDKRFKSFGHHLCNLADEDQN